MDSMSRSLKVVALAITMATAILTGIKLTPASANPAVDKGEEKVKHIENVHVVLICDKMRVSLNERLTLDALIRNDGADDIYLFQRMEWGAETGLDLCVRDEGGKRVSPSHSPLEPPPAVDDPTPLVRLEQGFFYGFRAQIRAGELVPGPGKFTIEAIYQSPFTRDLLNDRLRNLPALCLEDKPLESNKVPLEVVP
jgi:hypothetical protein